MGDPISTSFRNMGFNVLSNSENEYFEEQYQQNNTPNLTVGDSLVLVATSNKLLSSNNGTAVTADLTSVATSAGLLNTITGVAVGDNLTVAAGTNQGTITTAPIIYSANGLNYTKSTLATANFPANVVHYNRFGKVFYVGNTGDGATADSTVTYVPPNGQGMALAAGASDLFGNADSCRAIYSVAPGVSADPVTFLGGNFGANARLGFSTSLNLASITPITSNTGPDGLAGRVNAISCDDGLSDLTNYYVLVGGNFATGVNSNLIYTSSLLRSNPVAGNTQVFTNGSAAIFPAGTSSVNAIAFNGSVFLVGGLGTSGTSTNVPVVAISTFAAGAFTFAIPTGCNIASLMTNVNSLTWNGTYWIAGGTSAGGFVLAKSLDGATWTNISGAIAGATTASAVASKYQISTDVTNVQYASGYGTVTQQTNKATDVNLNAPCGRITMNGANLNAATLVSFTFNNSCISANDILLINFNNAVGAYTNYALNATVTGAGTATIGVTNISTGALAQAIVIDFVVIHCN